MTSFYDANQQQLLAWFTQIDTDRGGTLSVSELQRALQLAGLNFSGKFVNSLVNLVDADCSGKLSPEEFLQMHGLLRQAHMTFMNADCDRSGVLDLLELAGAFESLGFTLDKAPTGSFYTYCKSYDFDKSGRFSKEVFIAMYVTLYNAKRVHARLQSNLSFDVYLWSIAQL
uniref:EF-hand domain-containing protein n=1 Tax=Haptolina brevifila TaxID=156173 RepID=A0A7S2NAI7_9EUKA|mmetsp:Transcript_71201/g.141184  ORF Transcript_71201/g.141184 Transcript_71201/m.141184 type:complete len:171 (+) Transcript_71201:80-592(+)|eukprot:CAMPEP_0174699596 /NCGR_PEP_ID=MMETSP1094-20130205/4827_1 /TAXON_ID=156173 /ORGANISM="Chrysochromulina brevifilum, Strain UTEX LB 985" /LENGTH=170 /DNA_ID=CAMNT_0015896963 /DNA_START=80 /DNA_END=592 /DNA_ORIENTATION=+